MSHTGVAKVTISLPRDLLARADAARGDEPRSTWIARTLGAALGVGGPIESRSAPGSLPDGSAPSPAPRRAPVIRTAADVAAELTRESAKVSKEQAAAARAIGNRQAKLNAAKYGGKK